MSAGAWRSPKSYQQGMTFDSDLQGERQHLATAGIQRALIDRKYLSANPLTLDGVIGVKTTASIKLFQTEAGLVSDGQFGPKSARRLFLPYYVWWQTQCKIPDMLLYGQGGLESGFDPGAEGDNPHGYEWFDRGIHQFNRHWRPEVTDAMAYGDPIGCIGRAAADLRTNYDSLGAWQYAVAAHNSPDGARKWSTGGTPSDQLKEYVALVYAAARVAP